MVRAGHHRLVAERYEHQVLELREKMIGAAQCAPDSPRDHRLVSFTAIRSMRIG